MKRSTFIKLIPLVAGGPAVWASLARAQSAGADKTMTIVSQFQAGAPADIFARAIADELQATLKQTVVVDNRVGANGIVASAFTARAPADGNTLMVAVEPAVFSASALQGQPFKGMTDFEAVNYLGSLSPILAIAPNVPASNLREFIALLKSTPDKYTFGSAGVGSAGHLYVEKFNKEAGVKALHVPYKSYLPAMTDTMSGLVSYLFAPLSAMQFVKEGKLKALAIAGQARDPDHPDLPTFTEAGMKGFEVSTKLFLLAPKHTPAAVVSRLNAAVNVALAGRTFAGRVKTIGGVTIPAAHTPAHAASLLAQEESTWNQLVKSQGIELT
jgi:tripartite-type tricarboxylate transporter receptor subunit TctC